MFYETKHEEIEEIWGLKRPDGTYLETGYSGRPLHSEEDVRKDFDPALFGAGGHRPVIIRRIKTITTDYTTR